MAVPEIIQQKANDIRTKVYGREVRESLASGLEVAGDIADQANTKSEYASDKVDNIQSQVDQLVVEGDSSVEAAQARVDADGYAYTTLKERLDTEHTKVTAQLAQSANGNKPSWSVWEEFDQRGINVKWFGAKGDGVTDDTQAIQNAIDSIDGGLVIFPAGVYVVSSTIFLKSNLALVGAGKHLTTLKTSGEFSWLMYAMGNENEQLKNISISHLGVDASGRDTSQSTQGLGSIRLDYVSNVFVSELHATMTNGLIVLRPSYNFQITNINATEMIGPVASLYDSNKGVISNITLEKGQEAIDFFNCRDVMVNNIYGTNVDGENELIDMGSCQNITINNCIGVGFDRGIMCKTEPGGSAAQAFKNISIQGCQFYNFKTYGAAFAGYGGAGEDNKNVRVVNCTFESDKENAIGLFGRSDDIDALDEVFLKGNKIDVKGKGVVFVTGNLQNLFLHDNNIESREDRGVDIYSSAGVYADSNVIKAAERGVNCDGCKIVEFHRNEIIGTSGLGVNIRNTYAPNVSLNKLINIGGHGIYMEYTSINAVDSVARILGVTVKENKIVNFGMTTTSGYGIAVLFNISGETGVYHLLNISDNTIILDSEATLSSQRGVYLTKSDLDAIDYSKVDNNVIFNVPTPLSGMQHLGPNSTQNNNITKSP